MSSAGNRQLFPGAGWPLLQQSIDAAASLRREARIGVNRYTGSEEKAIVTERPKTMKLLLPAAASAGRPFGASGNMVRRNGRGRDNRHAAYNHG